MLDVKKLITGFLILTLGASMSAWILSGTNTAAPATRTTEVSSPAAGNGNAFLPTGAIPQDVASLLASQSLSTSTETALEQPDNLTGALGNSLLDNLVAENPNGIQTDENNNQAINQPDDSAILAELQNNPAVSNLSIPNWDIEAAEVPVRTTASASETDAATYSGAVDKIFNDSFVQNGVQGMVNNTSGADPSNVGYVQSSVTHALDATAALQTPANLADFQKSLVRFLVYEKNALSLAENANTDPVKTSLIFQNERLKYNVVLNEFKNQFEKAQTIKGFSLGAPTSGGKDAGLSFLGAILGIETAHAQWLTFDAANLGEMIWQYVQDIILQILKNTLISFIQNKVLKWIQGSGAPMFIQNWASDLVNAGEMSAINAINSNYACVNPNTVFPRVQIILNAIYKPGNNVCAMQFQSALSSGNLTNFFSNFSNGGFVTFGQTLMPSNDFYGGLFFTAQNAGKAAQQSQGVFSLKTTAQQGWQGVEKCADGSDPHGISKFCTQEGTTVEGSVNADGTCASGWTLQSRANNGQCADGSDPTTNSPGQITGQVFKTGMEGSPELITAANSIVGILNAMLSSLLNGLASMAVSAGSSAVAGATGIGSGSSGGSGVMGFSPSNSGPSGPALPGVSCLPAYQDIAFPTSTNQASVPFYAQGGATDSAGNQPTYSWSAPGSVSGSGGLNAGDPFTAIYDATGTYSISVVASTDNSNSTCTLVLD